MRYKRTTKPSAVIQYPVNSTSKFSYCSLALQKVPRGPKRVDGSWEERERPPGFEPAFPSSLNPPPKALAPPGLTLPGPMSPHPNPAEPFLFLSPTYSPAPQLPTLPLPVTIITPYPPTLAPATKPANPTMQPPPTTSHTIALKAALYYSKPPSQSCWHFKPLPLHIPLNSATSTHSTHHSSPQPSQSTSPPHTTRRGGKRAVATYLASSHSQSSHSILFLPHQLPLYFLPAHFQSSHF
nr:leucine-rich repeat extensin-like protein 3 [Penaeus vannamei]